MNLPNGHYLQNKKYQLLQVIGQGGFGITYRGILYTEVKGPLGTLKTDIPISIKEYYFKDYCYRNKDTLAVCVHSETGKLLFDKFREKLLKEARILSEVHHPNIVNVLDVFEENNTAYIAMEYISGQSLKYHLEKGGILAEAKVLKYVRQIGKALQFVHEKNILHLDIKPSNILIDKNDNARLIDFGVSKRYDMENQETSTTMLTLSKGFASIEQYDNEGTQTFSPCPDIYSLGATMYDLLTGKIPTESILRATRPMRKPSEINPAISARTEKVILKAMQINPADRYQTVAEMLEALGKAPVEAPEPDKDKQPDNAAASDETTLLVRPEGKGAPDEQTVVSSHVRRPSGASSSRKKKKKKGVYSIVFICIFAVIGASVALLIGNNGWSPDPVEMPPSVVSDSDSTAVNPSDPLIAGQGEEKGTNIKPVTNTDGQPATGNPTEGTGQAVPADGDTTHTNGQPTTTATDTTEEPNGEYQSLLASGKKKMDDGRYAEAYDDFIKAVSLKQTAEVDDLIRLSSVRMEEKQIAARKAQYEEKMSFGRFTIVRKKSNGGYGAIDDKGLEIIPCKYVGLDIADNGNRAFVREDGLYDIYNTNGEPEGSGRITY